MLYSEDQVRDMNRTCRDSGAVGATSRAWKHAATFLQNAPRGTRVLDFGAGRALRHVVAARRQFRQCRIFGAEIGANVTPNHVMLNDDSSFDVVVCSNVMNVQPTIEHVEALLDRLLALVDVGGLVVVNVAASPNRSGVDASDVQRMAHARGQYAACKNHVVTIVRDV